MLLGLKRVGRIIVVGMVLCLVTRNQALSQDLEVGSKERYVWIQVPYSIVSPGMTIGGDTSCYGESNANSYGAGSAYVQPYGNGASVNSSGMSLGSSYGYSKCTSSPSLQIPSMTTNKILSVHVDCQKMTYDAKGDGKGWRGWGDEQAVYERAAAACHSKKDGTSREDMVGKWEQAKAALAVRKADEIKALKDKKYDVEWCISTSLANINDFSPFWLIQPDMVGLTSREQVVRYISLSKASLESDCNAELKLIKSGASQERVGLFWEKVNSTAVEKAR